MDQVEQWRYKLEKLEEEDTVLKGVRAGKKMYKECTEGSVQV